MDKIIKSGYELGELGSLRPRKDNGFGNFEKFDLEKYFIAKISGADLKESKPHPEIFVLASELANERKENCMVIEDSTNGILAAHAAGIFCTAYKSEHSSGQNYEKATLVISDFSEVEFDKISTHF